MHENSEIVESPDRGFFGYIVSACCRLFIMPSSPPVFPVAPQPLEQTNETVRMPGYKEKRPPMITIEPVRKTDSWCTKICQTVYELQGLKFFDSPSPASYKEMKETAMKAEDVVFLSMLNDPPTITSENIHTQRLQQRHSPYHPLSR